MKALIVSCFNWYGVRLKPIRDILIQAHYEVTVLTADYDHNKKEHIKERYPECTYIKVPTYQKNLSFQRIRSHWIFGRKIQKWIKEDKPDLILCQIPPNNAAMRCAAYKKKNPETKLILDIIDLWPESLPMAKLENTLITRKWKKWRNDAITLADHVFTECDLYQKRLKEFLVPDKTSTLHLYKKQTVEERRLVTEIIHRQAKDDIIRFAFLGSMNNLIDIPIIRDCISTFIKRGKTCELHAIGDGSSRKEFERIISECGCKTFFYGMIFDETEKIRILTPCNYAFNIMKESVSVGLTIKSIDYFSYGLIMINNIKGDTWDIIEKNRAGYNLMGNQTEICMDYDRTKVLEIYDNQFSPQCFADKAKKVLGGLLNEKNIDYRIS